MLTPEQRTPRVLRLLGTEEPAVQIARRAGISEQTLYRWREEFLSGGEQALADRGSEAEQAKELKRLSGEIAERDRLIGELTIANRMLKKLMSTVRPWVYRNGRDGREQLGPRWRASRPAPTCQCRPAARRGGLMAAAPLHRPLWPDGRWTRRGCLAAPERVDKASATSLLPTPCPHSSTPCPPAAGLAPQWLRAFSTTTDFFTRKPSVRISAVELRGTPPTAARCRGRLTQNRVGRVRLISVPRPGNTRVQTRLQRGLTPMVE